MAIFAVSFLPQLAAGKSAARDDKGKGHGSTKSGCGTEALFKSNLDRFEVKIAEDVSP